MFVVWMLAALLSAESECTYDVDAQIQEVSSLAREITSSVLSPDLRTLEWSDNTGAKYLFRYGGCTHLARKIQVTVPAEVLTEAFEYKAYGLELAKKYWDDTEANLLDVAIESRQYLETIAQDGAKIEVLGTDYDIMQVEWKQTKDSSKIEAVWVRTF